MSSNFKAGKKIDVEESKKLGRIVYNEVEISNNVPIYISNDSESQKMFLYPFLYYFAALFLFFNIAAYVGTSLISKGKNIDGIILSIGSVVLYAVILILSSKYGFKKDKYGTFLSKSCKVVGSNGLVIFVFLAIFMFYPLFYDIDISVKYLMKKASLFYLYFLIDVAFQIFIVYLIEQYQNRKTLLNMILFLFQEISILCYLSVIIPIMFDEKIYIFIFYLIAIAITIILCFVNYIIVKNISFKRKNDDIRYYLVFEEERFPFAIFAILILFYIISFIPNFFFAFGILIG